MLSAVSATAASFLPETGSYQYFLSSCIVTSAEQTIKEGKEMEIVTEFAARIADYTVLTVGRHIGYVILYKSNIDDLHSELQKLKEAKAGVQHSIDAAKRNGEEIEESVQRWSKKVDDTVAEARIFDDKVGCSNMLLKHKLGRKAKKMTPAISEILAQGKFDRISYHPILPVTIPPSARDYMSPGSRTSILYDILQALKDASMYKIGVYGMGGVGKTTLIKELAWQAAQDGSFGVVVVATVTNNPKVNKIQGEIADGLGLKFNEETERGRSHRLRDRIRKEKNILVILDDIWSGLDLTEVGIPFGDDHGGCKLLMTSRDRNVLNCEMGTQKEFRLEVLSEEENWNLFEKMAGDVVNDKNFYPTALKVAKSCAGLPLLIVTVAKALKSRELYVWKDALKKLTRFDHDGLGKKVSSAIELSYNYLESDELRSFFLLIGSRAKEICTEDLLMHGWVLGLYKDVDKFVDARNRVYKLTEDLRASCLLLEGEKHWVGMHDIIYDVASSIASRTEPFFAREWFDEFKKWPKMDSLKRCHHIFLPWCYIKEIPERLECPECKTLLMCSKDNYLKVPDYFFVEMRELKFLDLGGLDCCPSPPPSLLYLSNLQALTLRRCMLEDITMVAKLTSLEILKLLGSDMKELPAEIGKLTNLRLLDLTGCSGLRVIPTNLISNLACLEELYMGDCFIQWEVEGTQSQSNHASLGELRHLNKLTALNLQIQQASVLPRDLLIFENLESYKILIGDNFEWSWSDSENFEISRTLKLNMGTTTNIHSDHGIKKLLNSVEDLYLADLKGVRNVLYQLNEEGFAQLKHLNVQNSDEMQYIIDSIERGYSRPAFSNLESLVLRNLTNMERICHGPFPAQSFIKLEVIKLASCEKLKHVIIYEMVKELHQLLEVEISQCKCMAAIIVEDDKEIDEVMLPKLRSLTLDCLPMLTSLYSKSLTTNMQSENHVAKHEDDLSIPTALFDEKVVLPNLESLKVSSINLKNIWDDRLASHFCIQNLTNLTIDNCGSLKYLFSSFVARGLVKLKHLTITRCNMLEDIFVPEENMGNLPTATKTLWNGEATLPSLETLVISHMESLKSIWKTQMAPNSFGKLNKMEIAFCEKLLIVFPSYVLNHLFNLESLLVTDCDALEAVFEKQDLNTGATPQGTPAIKLKRLTLERLPMLNHVFPLSLAKELLQLQVLVIKDSGVESIVAKDEMTEAAPSVLFPQLTSLTFWRLPKLRSFYSGLHTLDCTRLRKLDVYHCDELKVFTWESQNNIEYMDEQPLISFGKVISKIEELSLTSKDVAMICTSQLGGDYFYRVKALNLQCFHDELDQFPSGFLQRFTSLEHLKVACCGFTEMLWSESPNIEHIEKNIKLKSLNLNGLTKLEYLFNEKSLIPPILQNLETLEVHGCASLKNVVPSLVLFQNLDTLFVYRCHGLINLIASSAARSFLKLKTLIIRDCEMIEEIVKSEEGDTSEIAFMKLEYLGLVGLSMLTRFCKGNHSFKFPLLRAMHVVECPMMETFSQGLLSTPMLKNVIVTSNGVEGGWNGDLNTTITKIFRDVNKRKNKNVEKD